MNWKDSFRKGKEIIVSTCSKDSKPNANIVISMGFKDGKLMFADCQMKTTIKNLKDNGRVCIVGGYYRIIGNAKVYSQGKYFKACDADKEYPLKHAIVVSIKEVFDLNKVKIIL